MLGLDKQPHFEPQACHLVNLKRDFQRGRLCNDTSEAGLHNTNILSYSKASAKPRTDDQVTGDEY
jgi:hypothetical protein